MSAARQVTLLGGHGYIGRHIIRALLGKQKSTPSTKIVVTSRKPETTAGLHQQIATSLSQGSPQTTLVDWSETVEHHLLPVRYADLTDPVSIEKACADSDVIINLVGLMNETPPKWTFENVQHLGAHHVAQVAFKQGSKLIHISAIGADAQSDVPYATTKGKGEQAIRNVFASEKELRSIIIRPGLVIGKEDQFLNRFAQLTKYLPVFPIFGDGKSLFQPIFVKDLTQIIVNAIHWHPTTSTALKGSITVEVGGSGVYTFEDLIYRTTRKTRIENTLVKSLTPPYFFHLPVPLALVQAGIMEKIIPSDSPLSLTRDQIKLLQRQNVVTGSKLGHACQFHCVDGNAVQENVHQALFKNLSELKNVDDIYRHAKWTSNA